MEWKPHQDDIWVEWSQTWIFLRKKQNSCQNGTPQTYNEGHITTLYLNPAWTLVDRREHVDNFLKPFHFWFSVHLGSGFFWVKKSLHAMYSLMVWQHTPVFFWISSFPCIALNFDVSTSRLNCTLSISMMLYHTYFFPRRLFFKLIE